MHNEVVQGGLVGMAPGFVLFSVGQLVTTFTASRPSTSTSGAADCVHSGWVTKSHWQSNFEFIKVSQDS